MTTTPETLTRETMSATHPKLLRLAEGCYNGACNLYALINALSEAVKVECTPYDVKHNPLIPVILTQLQFLSEARDSEGYAMLA